MIEIYPSKLPGDPIEVHRIDAPVSIRRWVEDHNGGIRLDLSKPQPISIERNGKIVAVERWGKVTIRPNDDVRITFEAKGSVVSGIFGAIGDVLNSIFKIFIRTPSTSNSAASRQGDEIDMAVIKANQAKLNDPIREGFGRNRIYPDYAVQTRQYFIASYEDSGAGRKLLAAEQVSCLHLCVGMGTYQINPAEVFVGETSLPSLGDDAEFQIYPPGTSVEGFEATENWYPLPEVGGTSTGAAGLDLDATFDITPNPSASTYAFGPAPSEGTAAGTVSIPSGAGEFPGWQAGLQVLIDARRDVQFVRDPLSGQSGFVGVIDGFDYSAGDAVRILGDIDAEVVVDRIAPATQDMDQVTYLRGDDGVITVWIEPGSHRVSIQPRNQRFAITSATSQQIVVQHLDDDGTADEDWAGFDARQNGDSIVQLDPSTVTGGWTGPFAACPESEVTDTLEWDMFFQSGLIRFNGKGEPKDQGFGYEFQYRDMAVMGEWTTVGKSYYAQTTNQLAITERVDLPYAMRPQVRMRRLGAKPNDNQTYADGQWYGMRARLSRPSSYPDVTTIAIRIRTGERIAAQTENQFWCYATRALPPWDNAVGQLTPTRHIAPAVMYMLRNRGYSDADVDMAELGRLHATWVDRGDYFDHAYSDETALKEAVNHALGVGFAEMIVDRGRVVPVRDEPRSTFDHMYSPQNMTSELKISSVMKHVGSSDNYDGVDVEYLDIATGQKETVECRLPGDSGEKVESATVYGITDRTRAWRWGMRRRGIQKYRNRSFSFSTGFDSLNSRYLDYCQLSGDYEQYSESGQVVGFELSGGSMVLAIDRDLTWEEGVDHVLSLRREDGTAAGPYVASRGADDYRVIIPMPDFTPNLNPSRDLTQFAFGVVNRSFWPALIQSVTPSGSPVDDQEPNVSVTAANYDARVYAYDDASPA